ncbi:MAG: FAD-dependent oxidoreductase [Kofleriaceae bacterium]
MTSQRFDVAVVGAGASGAACAARLAEGGLRVVCLERRALAEAGARWVNGVPRAAFAEAGVALPEPPEHLGGPEPFHLVIAPAPGADARPALTLARHDVIHVDMRHLVRRLQARAERAGVTLRERVTVHGWDGEELATSAGAIAASRVVDASGLAGARLLQQPEVARVDLCAAAQQVHDVVDRAAAAAFLARHGARPGEAIGFLGVAGGYSVLNVHVDPQLATCGVLTGSIPALGHPSGKAILERFVAEHAWIGARQFGGAAAIPLRRPYDRLADERVALLGDAGCQVFPAHGSGVGAGLIAARVLADTILAGAPLRDYEVAWQRTHGALLASFDVLRRFTQQLDGPQVRALFGSGLAEPELVRAGLDQVRPRLALGSLGPVLARLPGAILRHPRLARGLLGASARSQLLYALYARYPRDLRRLPAWSRAVDRLLAA